MESETNNTLPFLDVLVKRSGPEFITSIYRKKTFTGQYVNFQSQCSRKRKVNLIKTLYHRALCICSPSTLEEEVNGLIKILMSNGYPEQLIHKTIRHHRERFGKPKLIGPRKCILPIKLPFLGSASSRLEKDLKTTTQDCYGAVEPRVIFTSKSILSPAQKDSIPLIKSSMVVYHFECCCGNNYIGQTCRRLNDRIKEHVPRCVLQHYKNTPDNDYTKSTTLMNAARRSSIAEHLLMNKSCGVELADQDLNFTILRKCSSQFELRVLESVLIAMNNPTLCKQQEFDFVTCLV